MGYQFTHRYGMMNIMRFVIEVAAKSPLVSPALGYTGSDWEVTNIVRTNWFTWALRISASSSFIPSPTPSKPSFDPNRTVRNSSRWFDVCHAIVGTHIR
jgi:hypothetical protein